MNRNTETFPARDIQLFKKKLSLWAGNFFSCVYFNFSGYRQFRQYRQILAGVGELEIMPAGQGIFPSLQKFHDERQDWLFGFLSYDLRMETEPLVFSKPDLRFDGIKFPSGYFFRPKHIIEAGDHAITIHSTENPREVFNSILQTNSSVASSIIQTPVQKRISKEEYILKVEAIREHIAKGDLYEMNLCQEFFLENTMVDPPTLFNKLCDISPAPFACFVKHGKRFLMSSSPERFLMKQGNRLTSQPMKGTIGRGEGPNDDLMKIKLKNDSKERAENIMIVDLVRNDLARSAVAGSVKVEELFGVYTFPQVHQMISTVSATLRDDIHFAEAIRRAFPMGSMTGAPKVMAMQLIDELEPVKRGLYSGSVGFITPEGDFDFNVVIRSLLYNAESKYLSFQTGGAITYDCVAETEYQECLLKAKGMLQVISNESSSSVKVPTP